MADGMMIRGPQYGGTGSFTPPTASRTGAQRTALAQGRYSDSASQGRVFWGANQSAATWSVALAATHTGLVLSNPRGSRVDLHVLMAGFALTVAPAGIASIGFFGGYDPAGIVTHTTPLTALCMILDQDQAASVGKIDAAATLPGTPRWLTPFMGGFTAAALPSTGPALIDLGGVFIVPPGSYFGIGALTAAVGLGSLVWEEVPRLDQ